MLPSREVNLPVGAPIVMLRKRRGLRSVLVATIACKIEEPEDGAANGSSSQEPGGQPCIGIRRLTSDVTI